MEMKMKTASLFLLLACFASLVPIERKTVFSVGQPLQNSSADYYVPAHEKNESLSAYTKVIKRFDNWYAEMKTRDSSFEVVTIDFAPMQDSCPSLRVSAEFDNALKWYQLTPDSNVNKGTGPIENQIYLTEFSY